MASKSPPGVSGRTCDTILAKSGGPRRPPEGKGSPDAPQRGPFVGYRVPFGCPQGPESAPNDPSFRMLFLDRFKEPSGSILLPFWEPLDNHFAFQNQ